MSSVYYIINIYNIYTTSCNYNQFILILIMKKLLYFSMVIKIIPHETIVTKIRNEVKPKLCNKKSAVMPP